MITLKELKTIDSKEKLSKLLGIVSPNEKFKKNNNLLHLAVYTGNLVVLEAAWDLMDREAALDETNDKGLTPSKLAYSLGFIDLFLWLEDRKDGKSRLVATDWWAEFFQNLKKEKINTKSNWTTYRGSEIRLKRRAEHHRGGIIKKSHLFAQELGLSYDVKIPRFLTTPIKLWHYLVNWVIFIFSSKLQSYPWKKNSTDTNHPYVECFFTKTSAEVGAKFKAKSLENKSNSLAVFCALCDNIFQEEFLLEKQKETHNVLTLNFTSVPEPRHSYHTNLSILPFTIPAARTVDEKARKINNKIKVGVFLKTFLSMDLEIKTFNFLYKNYRPMVEKFINGRRSRFACYSYFGDYKVSPEVFAHEFIGLGRANPMFKISTAFHFKNNELVISLDMHTQIISNRKEEHERILNKIKAAVEEYAKD